MTTTEQRIGEAAAYLREHGVHGGFDAAIVLGTGLGSLADAVEDPLAISYADIPHFPGSGVSGHRNRLVAGRIEGRRILILAGRAHYYEAGDAGAMRVPVGVVAALGVPVLLLTNAAGAIAPSLPALVLVSDHIDLSGRNPLVGETGDGRFVDMVDAYDPGLRVRMRGAAAAAKIPLGEGVYMWFSGPSFETPAEIRMARTLGADLVGMSTVPETILARYHGLKVVAVSVVTNPAAGLAPAGGLGPSGISHAETKSTAADAATSLTRLVRAFLAGTDHA